MKGNIPKYLSYFSVLFNIYALGVWVYTFIEYDTTVASEEYFDNIGNKDTSIVVAGVQLFLLMTSILYFGTRADEFSKYLFWVQIAFLLFFLVNLA